MIRIEYPDRRPDVKCIEGVEKVFCICRRRWVKLTPEEWVRQNFLVYLTDVLNYPAKLIAVERLVKVGELQRRFDIVVFDPRGTVNLLIECKEMKVALTDKSMMQLLAYNSSINARILVITNGSYCAAFENTDGIVKELDALPAFGTKT